MNKDGVSIKGFFRVKIKEDGTTVGDSGWKENMTTDLGFKQYLCAALVGDSPTAIGYIALGTGGTPATDAVTLAGEIMASTKRKAVTTAYVNSHTAQFTATFASSDSFVTTTYDISNIGLYYATTTNDTLFAGNVYASSTLNTNQDVNITYQIRFSTA